MHRDVAQIVRRLVVMSAAVTLSMSGASAASAHQSDQELDDLTELRQTTAPFHDVENALAAGWTEQPVCMDYPDGYMGEPPGTMGHHFFNVEYIRDGGHIEPSEPELILYEKQADGTWRLNAVEYIIPASDLPPTAEPPMMFGQEFKFHPDVGSAGIWGLHVWLWRHNPHGLYAELNPLVSCEHSDMQN